MITFEYAQSVGLTPKIFRERFRHLHIDTCWIATPPPRPLQKVRQVRRSPLTLTHEDKEKIGNLYIDGVRVLDIASMFNLHEQSVYRVLTELGIPRNNVSRKSAFQI